MPVRPLTRKRHKKRRTFRDVVAFLPHYVLHRFGEGSTYSALAAGLMLFPAFPGQIELMAAGVAAGVLIPDRDRKARSSTRTKRRPRSIKAPAPIARPAPTPIV